MNTDQTLLSNWQVQSNELEQVHATPNEQVVLKGETLTKFEFGVSMRLRHTAKTGQPAFGVLLQYAPQEQLQVRYIQQDGNWKLAVTSAGITPVIDHVLAQSTSFKPEQWHTLRLVQQADQLQLHLDDEYVLAISEPARAAQPGLLTHNAAADFVDIWQNALHA
ncbi:MAG: hypothetical protein NVS2B12_36590 [Ktedonobacteraceae bacterium]